MWNMGGKSKSKRIPKFGTLGISCLVPFAEMSKDVEVADSWEFVESEMPLRRTTGNDEQTDGNESLDFRAR